MKTTILTLVLILFLLPSSALALRCNSRVIQEGDSSFRVERYCGEPQSRVFVGYEKIARYNAWGGKESRKVEVWHWYYDRGRGKFLVRLKFRGDVLHKIVYQDRL